MMLHDRFGKVGLFISTSLFMLVGYSAVLAAEVHPDFSGVWTTYTEPGAGNGGRGPAPE